MVLSLKIIRVLVMLQKIVGLNPPPHMVLNLDHQPRASWVMFTLNVIGIRDPVVFRPLIKWSFPPSSAW